MPRPSTFTQIEFMDFYQLPTVAPQSNAGQLAISDVGDMFRLVQAGAAALVKGNLIQAPARATNFTDMAVQAAVATSVAINSTGNGYPIPVTLGGTATTSTTQFAGGTLAITVTPGIGQTFTIVSNDVQSTTNGTCNFYVLEPIQTALTTSSKATVHLNPFTNVIQSPTTITGEIVGVAVTAIGISNWGWLKTKGPAAVLSDATVATIGQGVQRSTATAGSVSQLTTNGYPLGQAMVLGVSAEDEPVWLHID